MANNPIKYSKLPLCFTVFFIITTLPIHASSYPNSDPILQQKLDLVSKLPGLSSSVNFAHYAGYINVNQEFGRNIFYWFFEAVEEPETKPLILWLNGGPGCSSIAYGEAEEIGPFGVGSNGDSINLNPYSWNQVANVIFLDSPTGVGFSYSTNSSDYKNNGDKRTAEDSLVFLLNWLERFPQYQWSEFYLTGESYAGHFIPQLSQEILKHNKASEETKINLKGILLGNPLIDDHWDQVGIFQFMWTNGMISDEAFKNLKANCSNEPYLNSSKACEDAHNSAAAEIGNVDYYSTITPPCSLNSASSNRGLRSWQVGLLREDYDACTEYHSYVYFNEPEVQEALHVHNSPIDWEPCNNEVRYTWKDSQRSLLSTIKALTRQGLRIWIFSGDTDASIPVTSTRYSIRAMRLPTLEAWTHWSVDEEVIGWTQEYKGLRFVTVRGGGHEVALHKPKEALIILKSFLAGKPLPTPTITDS